MAVVCRSHRLLFIQAPRTGCTAIEKLLFDRFGGEALPSANILDADEFFRVPRKHCSISQLLEEGLIPPNYRELFTTFTAVRNPYDSLASLYVKKREKYRPLLADKTSWIYKVPGYVEDMEFCHTHSFEEWIQMHYPVRWIDKVFGRGKRSLHERYTRGVQHVMRFERLQQDFEAVMRGCGVEGDLTIPNVNPTVQRKAEYQSYYTPQARRTVEYVFSSDLEKYAYSFAGLHAEAGPLAAESSR
jgi:hypothetical protein